MSPKQRRTEGDARYQAKYVSAIWQKLIPNQADF